MEARDTTLGGAAAQDIRKLFATYKQLGDKSFAQLTDEQMRWKADAESNSIAVIIMHMSGNFLSRWTDFLSTDGEKPWRNRDGEFEEPGRGKAELLERWEAGWACLFSAVDSVKDSDLLRTITIRGEPHTVLQALNRSLTHCAYHVGQIVYIAKVLKTVDWVSLSIPRKRGT
ncbi:MAG: DUF1572 family protein [Spirochaetia bacterium]